MLVAVAGGGTAAASARQAGSVPGGQAAGTAVRDCGTGPALTRPGSMILTCADDGELATGLHWTSWTATTATGTGTVTWRACATLCADSRRWDHTSASFTLTRPATRHGRTLFTVLTMHATGRTPRGFMRSIAWSEAPADAAGRPDHRQATAAPPTGAPSGTLGYAAIEGFWVIAGGPNGSAGSYTQAQVAAAITGGESSFLPGIIQPGVDYCGAGADRAGWGLWQITCGNSVPQYGSDFQVLDPWNNAEAAIYKCRQDEAAGDNCFAPWSTWASGAYQQYLQHTTPDTNLTDPGEYVQVNSTPPGTPSSPGPAPGSRYGPPMPGSATAYVFWKGTGSSYDLWQAQGPANGGLTGPVNRGMGPLNSAPTVGINSSSYTYVYWEGTGPQDDLWEAYWNGSGFSGRVNRGQGPLNSAPSVAVYSR